ncbi:MAG: ATP-binding protein [Actinomycetota bacterium]
MDPATARDVDAALALPASLDSLTVARSVVERALHETGWDPEAAGPVVLATGEAVANAILHGSRPDAAVRLALAVTPDRALVRVVDQGRRGAAVPVCPATPPPPSSVHGRGLFIMRAMADRLSVRPEGGGTEVVMVFRRAA